MSLPPQFDVTCPKWTAKRIGYAVNIINRFSHTYGRPQTIEGYVHCCGGSKNQDVLFWENVSKIQKVTHHDQRFFLPFAAVLILVSLV